LFFIKLIIDPGETAFSSGVDTWEGVGQSLVAVAGVNGGVNVLDLDCGTLVSNIARYIYMAHFTLVSNIARYIYGSLYSSF